MSLTPVGNACAEPVFFTVTAIAAAARDASSVIALARFARARAAMSDASATSDARYTLPPTIA